MPNAEAFTADVMAKVEPRRGRITRSAPLFRLGVPLAAAAAVVLAVIGAMWFAPSPEPFIRVVYEPWASGRALSVQSEDAPQDAARMSPVVVSYARTLDGDEARTWVPPGISLGSVGSAAIHTWSEELPPI